MINKSYCKLCYGDGEGIVEEELEDYYDFSFSYKILEDFQLVFVDSFKFFVLLVFGGYEFVIKGFGDEVGIVKRIGLRDMVCYFW